MKPTSLVRPVPALKNELSSRATHESDEVIGAPDGAVHDRPIGAILMDRQKLSEAQIDEVLTHQRARGMRFGEAAVSLGFVTNDDVLSALAQQFHYPYPATAQAPKYRELAVAANPFGEQAESFRELRSQLIMGVLSPDGPRRALAVVSPDVGDGKSFIAANLAVAFSQLGVHTLLIDVDMRTPRQHQVFGLGQTGGLSNILSGRSEANVIRPVADLPNLFVLPVGNMPPNPLELVQRPAFAMLIQELLLKFDYIVVDTPANSHGADARVVAAACGAALAVGRQGKSALRAMQKLVAALSNGRTVLAGVVINDR